MTGVLSLFWVAEAKIPNEEMRIAAQRAKLIAFFEITSPF